jgi:hypothetical protein
MSVRTVGRLGIVLIASLSFGISHTKAQDLSPEADQAFWCAAAYANYVKKAAFASPEQQAAALADASRLEGAMVADAARLGWQQSDVISIAKAYDDEVGPQVDDYLLWKDPAALRLSLADCFPSAGF